MKHLRCVVILPADYPDTGVFEEAMVAAWGQIVRWIEWHTDTILYSTSPWFIRSSLSAADIELEATRPNGNLPDLVLVSPCMNGSTGSRVADRIELLSQYIDMTLIFVPMGGNYAGAQLNGAEPFPWAMVGESVFGPLMEHFGLPEWNQSDLFPKDFEGIHSVDTAFGTATHELCHLFGLGHPRDARLFSPIRIQGRLYRNVMDEHTLVSIDDIEKHRFIPSHKNTIRASEYVQSFLTYLGSSGMFNRFNAWVRDIVRARNVTHGDDFQ